MSGRRSFVAVVFALLLGGSFLAVGCGGNPASPSSTTTTTVQPPAKTTLSIAQVIPSAPVTFTYGDSVSVDVSWEMTAEDWANSPLPAVYVCLAQDKDTFIADACRGKVLQGPKGSFQGVPATIPSRAPSNTVSQTLYAQIFLVRNGNLSPYQESLDVQNTLYFPLTRLAPIITGEPIHREIPIAWTSVR
jgi:hypothetical protein